MVFGIYGAHCTGKTFFLRSLRLAKIRKVYGDHTAANFRIVPEFSHYTYYRHVDAKCELIDYAMRDNSLWVIEGCRFWGGMLGHVADMLDAHNGGLFLLTVTTSSWLLLDLLIKRAKYNNRTLKLEYWTENRLKYEARIRHLNACNRYLDAADWVHIEFMGDYSMWDGFPIELLYKFYEGSAS